MSKFKMPSAESFRERIASSVSKGEGNKDALMAVDYSLEHPSSSAEKLEQANRAIRERDAIRKKKG